MNNVLKLFAIILIFICSNKISYCQQSEPDSVQTIIEKQRLEIGVNFFFVYGGLNLSTNYYDAFFDLSISPGRKFNDPLVYNDWAINTKVSFPVIRFWDKENGVSVSYIGISYIFINENPSEIGLSGSGYFSSINYLLGFKNITGINHFFGFLKDYTYYFEFGYSSQNIKESFFAKKYLNNPYFGKFYISAGLSYKIL